MVYTITLNELHTEYKQETPPTQPPTTLSSAKLQFPWCNSDKVPEDCGQSTVLILILLYKAYFTVFPMATNYSD